MRGTGNVAFSQFQPIADLLAFAEENFSMPMRLKYKGNEFDRSKIIVNHKK